MGWGFCLFGVREGPSCRPGWWGEEEEVMWVGLGEKRKEEQRVVEWMYVCIWFLIPHKRLKKKKCGSYTRRRGFRAGGKER